MARPFTGDGSPPTETPRLRPLTLEQARARYPQRFTLDHTPGWATYPLRRDRLTSIGEDYPGPQYYSDEEWYERTTFPGENGLSPATHWCISARPTWPLGERLPEPYFPPPLPALIPNPARKPVTKDDNETRQR